MAYGPWGTAGYGAGAGYGYGYGACCGYGAGYTPVATTGGYGNGFVLLVVLFILLIIVGNNYPMGQVGGA